MKCPYCNKELGEKNECITSGCYAFGKIFPRYDLEEKPVGKFSNSHKNQKETIKSQEKIDNSTINSKLEEIEKNAKSQKNIPEENDVGTSTNAGLYILIAIIILLIIGFLYF
ncbi:hypothetical protein [Clostridium taeniosporum]|uniref:Uncharacterized protein n=1 Tax=Clostridium taeniosporum TaxID=394958 RepID=A0A1D7XMM7_9CLOT|nr:hypothetical protein [Clostridium taeniosporum]AOR24605.1 hypothetical protein BGI42_13025 [Clostridium taeniosporum]